MRKIFFRGERVDNGKWVCGYYVLRKRPYFKATDSSESAGITGFCIKEIERFKDQI